MLDIQFQVKDIHVNLCPLTLTLNKDLRDGEHSCRCPDATCKQALLETQTLSGSPLQISMGPQRPKEGSH